MTVSGRTKVKKEAPRFAAKRALRRDVRPSERPKAETRGARIELRTTREEKNILSRAAARESLDLTSFIMRSVLPVARDVIDKADRIVLSERDAKLVLDLLENPPEPTKALLDAARWWRDRR
jgi:uncharacterized protein (DUF1778 family)